MVDAAASKTAAFGHEGSTPSRRTKQGGVMVAYLALNQADAGSTPAPAANAYNR